MVSSTQTNVFIYLDPKELGDIDDGELSSLYRWLSNLKKEVSEDGVTFCQPYSTDTDRIQDAYDEMGKVFSTLYNRDKLDCMRRGGNGNSQAFILLVHALLNHPDERCVVIRVSRNAYGPTDKVIVSDSGRSIELPTVNVLFEPGRVSDGPSIVASNIREASCLNPVADRIRFIGGNDMDFVIGPPVLKHEPIGMESNVRDSNVYGKAVDTPDTGPHGEREISDVCGVPERIDPPGVLHKQVSADLDELFSAGHLPESLEVVELYVKERQHVHGKIDVTVDAASMVKDGYDFFRGDSDAVVTKEVPLGYIHRTSNSGNVTMKLREQPFK